MLILIKFKISKKKKLHVPVDLVNFIEQCSWIAIAKFPDFPQGFLIFIQCHDVSTGIFFSFFMFSRVRDHPALSDHQNLHRKYQRGFRTPPPPSWFVHGFAFAAHSINLLITLLSITQNIGTPFGLFVRKVIGSLTPPSRPSTFFLCIPLNITLRYSRNPPHAHATSPSVSFFKSDPVITVVSEFDTRDPISCFLSLLNVLNVYKLLNDQDLTPTAADDILRKLERLQLTALCKSSTCIAIRKKIKKMKTYIPTRGALIIVRVPDSIGSRWAMTGNPPPPY